MASPSPTDWRPHVPPCGGVSSDIEVSEVYTSDVVWMDWPQEGTFCCRRVGVGAWGQAKKPFAQAELDYIRRLVLTLSQSSLP